MTLRPLVPGQDMVGNTVGDWGVRGWSCLTCIPGVQVRQQERAGHMADTGASSAAQGRYNMDSGGGDTRGQCRSRGRAECKADTRRLAPAPTERGCSVASCSC